MNTDYFIEGSPLKRFEKVRRMEKDGESEKFEDQKLRPRTKFSRVILAQCCLH